jgi:gamma-butyrobetaine dioxygenase
LHDIGYFLIPGSETSIGEGRNIKHEALGAAWLSRAFGEEITAPIALHVEAKRYLCAVEPDYFGKLSHASRLSLETQGGIMRKDEAAAFARQPGFEAALILRRCDDGGKDLSMHTPNLEHFRGLLTAALRKSD